MQGKNKVEHAISYLLQSDLSHQEINEACDILYTAHRDIEADEVGQNVPPDEAEQFVQGIRERIEQGSWRRLKALLEVEGEEL
jgi:hypothetical protein